MPLPEDDAIHFVLGKEFFNLFQGVICIVAVVIREPNDVIAFYIWNADIPCGRNATGRNAKPYQGKIVEGA